jgi:hypothetical protein
MNRYQPRGKPNVPAKGKPPPPPPQQIPQPISGGHVQGNSNPIPQQQPSPATPGVPVQGKKGKRTPATTAYSPTTTQEGEGKKKKKQEKKSVPNGP